MSHFLPLSGNQTRRFQGSNTTTGTMENTHLVTRFLVTHGGGFRNLGNNMGFLMTNGIHCFEDDSQSQDPCKSCMAVCTHPGLLGESFKRAAFWFPTDKCFERPGQPTLWEPRAPALSQELIICMFRSLTAISRPVSSRTCRPHRIGIRRFKLVRHKPWDTCWATSLSRHDVSLIEVQWSTFIQAAQLSSSAHVLCLYLTRLDIYHAKLLCCPDAFLFNV